MNESKFTINEEQAEQVRRMFAEAAEGQPLSEIARLINQVERERILARMRDGREQEKARKEESK